MSLIDQNIIWLSADLASPTRGWLAWACQGSPASLGRLKTATFQGSSNQIHLSPTYLPVAALSPLRSPPASPQYSQQRPPPATSSLLDTIKFSNCSSDLSTTLENQKRRMEWLESNFQRGGNTSSNTSSNNHHQSNSKIIAAVSPGKDGHATTRILSSRSLKDTLPRLEPLDLVHLGSIFC